MLLAVALCSTLQSRATASPPHARHRTDIAPWSDGPHTQVLRTVGWSHIQLPLACVNISTWLSNWLNSFWTPQCSTCCQTSSERGLGTRLACDGLGEPSKEDSLGWEPKVGVACCGSDILSGWSQDRDSRGRPGKAEMVWATAGWRLHPALPTKKKRVDGVCSWL